MRVKLKRTFIFQGQRYREGIHSFPEGTVLPSDAVWLDAPVAKKLDEDPSSSTGARVPKEPNPSGGTQVKL